MNNENKLWKVWNTPIQTQWRHDPPHKDYPQKKDVGSWIEKAEPVFKLFVKNCRASKKSFTIEDFKEFANKKKLIAPDSNKKWGDLIRVMASKGVISTKGYTRKSMNPASRGRRILVWI